LFAIPGYRFLFLVDSGMSFLLHFQVNRNPIADEMKRMRQHIEYLQAELVSARGGVGSDDVQVNVPDKLGLQKAFTHTMNWNNKA
jgi:hypothetical protein